MTALLRAAFRLYPRWWWARYGAELEALVQDTAPRWSTVADLVAGALSVRLHQRAPAELRFAGSPALFWRPAAFVPVAMSLGALLAVLTHLVIAGAAPQSDEGTAAHLWQILMLGQVPVIAWFAVTSLPTRGRRAAAVTAVQLCSAAAAVLPVLLLRW
jgi:hypothetical protein